MVKVTMMMVKMVMVGVVILLLSSCGLSGSSFRIKGTFRDMQTGELYIYNLSAKNARLDTLTIQEGKFLYRGEADEVTPYVLVFPNGMEQVIFVGPATDVVYEATANDLKNYVVNGSEENQLMNQFRQETYTQNPSQMKVTARKYIKEHPLSLVAVYLLDTYFVQDDEVSNTEIQELLKTLKAKQPQSHYLLDIDSKVVSAEKNSIGKKLPDVSLMKRDKKMVKLWAQSKEFNLVAFWALWMPNGYDFLWKLRQCEGLYDGDRLRIVTVSLDLERYRWEDATRVDTLRHIDHYCDGLGFESKALKTLGVHDIPYYILTDKNHQVLETGNDVNQMADMLKKHLEATKEDEKKNK